MAETDWQELCRELVQHAANAQAVLAGEGLWDGDEDDGLFERATAALAAAPDGPAVPTGREPASVAEELGDEELAQAAKAAIHDYKYPTEVVYFPDFDSREYEPFLLALRAAIAADRARPPAPVAEGEVGELAALIRQIALAWEPDACLLGNMTAGQLGRAADLLERIPALEADLERERLRLAACGVIAKADTPESAAKARDMHPDVWSASADDVAQVVDALMATRSAPMPVADDYKVASDKTMRGIRSTTKRWKVTVTITTNDSAIDTRLGVGIWKVLDTENEILESVSLPQLLLSNTELPLPSEEAPND